nr:hypothetical protein [Micromonospora sp. DSM 115978]
PAASTVCDLASAWDAGDAVAPSLAQDSSVLSPDEAVSGLEGRAVLSRHLLRDRATFLALPRSRELGQLVRGAVPADLDWLAGTWRAATAGYDAILDAAPAEPHAWSGLGLDAHDRRDTRDAAALAERPELVRAVHRELAADASQRPPSRLAVARWLGGSSTRRRLDAEVQ